MKISEQKSAQTTAPDSLPRRTVSIKDYAADHLASMQAQQDEWEGQVMPALRKAMNKMESQESKKPVFIQRAKGMPFEEFVKVCIQRFKEAGLLAPTASSNLPDEAHLQMVREHEAFLSTQFSRSESTTEKKPRKS